MKQLINNLEVALAKTKALEDMKNSSRSVVNTEVLKKETELQEFLRTKIQF